MKTVVVYYQNEKDGYVSTLPISYNTHIEVMQIEALLKNLIPNAIKAWY